MLFNIRQNIQDNSRNDEADANVTPLISFPLLLFRKMKSTRNHVHSQKAPP